MGLVSSGSSGEESAFLDASEGGGDVFFLSSARLVAGDTGSALAVYDAHVCSVSEPCAGEVAAAASCDTADSCRAAPCRSRRSLVRPGVRRSLVREILRRRLPCLCRSGPAKCPKGEKLSTGSASRRQGKKRKKREGEGESQEGSRRSGGGSMRFAM